MVDSRKLTRQFNSIMKKYFDPDVVASEYGQDIVKLLKLNSGVYARYTHKRVEIISRGLDALSRLNKVEFIDMKEAFARSSKAKQKKDGGWYLIVPLGTKARDLKAVSSSKYNQLREAEIGKTLGMGDSIPRYQAILQHEDQTGIISDLRYDWKSTNVTKVGSGGRGSYIAFRTVSDKSDPTSWILGRQAYNENDPIVDETIKTQLLGSLQQALEETRKNFKILR